MNKITESSKGKTEVFGTSDLGSIPSSVAKKPVVAFTVADNKNLHHAQALVNSIRKFYTEEELPIVVYGQEVLDQIQDPGKFYKQKPLFGSMLIDQYETVIGMDADMICLGKFDHFWKGDFDFAPVLNFNRADFKQYGPITFPPLDPTEYMNAGLVVMKNPQFVRHWLNLCNGKYFEKMQYREQDFLNILYHFGDYKVKCLDYKTESGEITWNGLISKGEHHRAELRNGEVWLPGNPEEGYPIEDVRLTFLHTAGGQGEKKILDTFRVYFTEEVADYIASLIK